MLNEIFSLIFSMYIYLAKRKRSLVRLQLTADILDTYEFKVVTVCCHSAVMNHI